MRLLRLLILALVLVRLALVFGLRYPHRPYIVILPQLPDVLLPDVLLRRRLALGFLLEDRERERERQRERGRERQRERYIKI